MKRKRASLIINPRAGQNLTQLSALLAILAAAGWKTKLALKEYGGQTMALAQKAAESGSERVIAYGGDGTLNQVVNGVMHTQKRQSIVGLIPGGTANVWASEIGVPGDPVDAALALIDSEARKVDVGRIAVEGLTSPTQAQDELSRQSKKTCKKRAKASSKARQHFLLMAGLGIDAAIMSHVSKPLKYRVGPLAVGVSTARELPAQHPFPVEIRAGGADSEGIHWKGEALQVVVGNTRLYADIVQMTPDAYIDDGILDVCVITAGNPLTTMQQIASLLLRHQPDNLTAEHFQGAPFLLSVPASVALQLDGSAMKLKDYLSKTERKALARADESKEMMVTYRFDAMPHALPMAIPRAYKGALFETSEVADDQQTETAQASAETGADREAERKDEQQQEVVQRSEEEQQENLEQIEALLEQGRKVRVAGVSAIPAQQETYILAGNTTKQSTGEDRPVAIRVDARTLVRKKTGEDLPLQVVSTLRAGDTLIVAGKKRKRGIIEARQIVIDG